jgi:hypothetical protein
VSSSSSSSGYPHQEPVVGASPSSSTDAAASGKPRVATGLMAWLMGLTPEKIAKNDPSVLTEYGHLVETFAVGEVLKQVSWWDGPVAVGHFRTAAADEVDLVLERDDGAVIAFEIKAGTRVDGADLAGIRALRGRLGAIWSPRSSCTPASWHIRTRTVRRCCPWTRYGRGKPDVGPLPDRFGADALDGGPTKTDSPDVGTPAGRGTAPGAAR